MTQDHGTSLRDRAVVPSASSPQAGSPVPASIPSAGDAFTVVYPFVRDTYQAMDADGCSDVETWRPGVNHVWVSDDHTAPVADGLGSATFTVVDAHKPGRFPARVFFTRKFTSPDGHVFGKGRLHIVTLEKFRRLTNGYQHPFGVGEPLSSHHQWWRPSEAEREFRQLLVAYAQGIEARSDETLQAAQPEGREPGAGTACAQKGPQS